MSIGILFYTKHDRFVRTTYRLIFYAFSRVQLIFTQAVTPVDRHRVSSTVSRAKALFPFYYATPRRSRNLSRRGPMYFRHFTWGLSADADSSRWSIARSGRRCLFTVDTDQREVINYRLTRVSGREETVRALAISSSCDACSQTNRRKASYSARSFCPSTILCQITSWHA